jgi:hypothetical protein
MQQSSNRSKKDLFANKKSTDGNLTCTFAYRKPQATMRHHNDRRTSDNKINRGKYPLPKIKPEEQKKLERQTHKARRIAGNNRTKEPQQHLLNK